MILKIDTSDSLITIVELKNMDGKLIDSQVKKRKFGSQALLPAIKKILTQNKLSIKDLRGIEVNTGPGSFTGLRVGVSAANTLSYFLKIPINGRKPGELVFPKYT